MATTSTKNKPNTERCGCPRIIPDRLGLTLHPLPSRKKPGWYCDCGKTFLPLAKVAVEEMR